MKYGYIYRAYNKINGLSYIGQTTDFKRRKTDHLASKDDFYFCRALRKYGKDAFGWEIIFSDVPLHRLNEIEEKVIKAYNTFHGPGYNSMPGTGQVLYGENNPFYGKRHSEEVKQKLAESKTGIKNPRARLDVWSKKEEIIKTYLDGKSTRHLGRIYDCDNNTIKLILKSENIKIRRTG